MDEVNIAQPRLYVHAVKAETPNYKELVASGQPLPEQPYSLDIYRANLGEWWTDTQNYSHGTPTSFHNGTRYVGCISDNDTEFQIVKGKATALVNDVYDKRVNRALSKVQGMSLSVGIMYRERRETGRLLIDFVDKAFKTLRYWRRPSKVMQVWGFRGKRNLSPRFSRSLRKRLARCPDFGSVFLQYRFAWLPLWKDIEDSLDASASSEAKLNKFSARSGTPFEFSKEYDLSHRSLSDDGNVWQVKIKGYCGVRLNYEISDLTLLSLGSLTNVAATFWDAVPWSFVVDRFINISQYLDLYDATIGTNFKKGSHTTFYNLVASPPDCYHTYYPDILTWETYRYGRKYFVNRTFPPREEVYMRRIVLSEFPAPRLVYPAFQWKHLADYCALLKQKFSKRKDVVAL